MILQNVINTIISLPEQYQTLSAIFGIIGLFVSLIILMIHFRDAGYYMDTADHVFYAFCHIMLSALGILFVVIAWGILLAIAVITIPAYLIVFRDDVRARFAKMAKRKRELAELRNRQEA